MKAIISSTYDDRYLWFLPLTTWAWNKLGVDVICFMPENGSRLSRVQYYAETKDKLVIETANLAGRCRVEYFSSPKHKESTYAQCSRLYGGCLDLPEDEIIITSDVDMAVFIGIEKFLTLNGCDDHVKSAANREAISIYGADLVPDGQYPMCFVRGSVMSWRKAMGIGNKTYQECLDEILGHEEMENMRGNLWSRDQELLKNCLKSISKIEVSRARPGTQFADNRVDRDDANWRSYLNDNLIDAHLWRPGYTDENFANIMELMTTMYPNDNFSWLVEYNEKYKQLL